MTNGHKNVLFYIITLYKIKNTAIIPAIPDVTMVSPAFVNTFMSSSCFSNSYTIKITLQIQKEYIVGQHLYFR
ncbi:MAG: hypothetical protein BGP13_00985 [Sphingobacteriales bacterium 40-81]|nr:MAG: hypothetical protein BGP13_00985 [Sphingobacteriales bacterium 40-81]